MSDAFLDEDDFDGRQLPEPKPRPDLDDPRCGFFHMPAEEYFADPIEEGSLSNSGIKILLDESPLDFAFQSPRHNPDAIEKAAKSAAMRRGDLVHQLALGKGRGFEIGDFPDFKTKAAQEWKKAVEADGRCAALRSKFEEAEVMAEVIVERIKRILDGAAYETEVVIVWREETPAGEIYMRGMLDIWCEERAIILDPKVTDSLGNGRPGQEKIQRHAVNMGWDRQGALYKRGVARLRPDLDGRVRFGNLMIKPEAPFTSRLLWPDSTATITALYEARPAMLLFAQCQAAGRWPGYPEEGEPLSLPSYEENRRLEQEIHVHG